MSMKDDVSAVVSLLSSLSDNGAAWVEDAYRELRRGLEQGRIADAQEIGSLLEIVLKIRDGGVDDESAENQAHKTAMRLLMDGIGAILVQDFLTGIEHLRGLTSTVSHHRSIAWIAWLWTARAAVGDGQFEFALDAAKQSLSIAESLEPLERSITLCDLGEIEFLCREHQSALKHLLEATRVLSQVGEKRHLAKAWLNRARIHFHEGKIDQGFEAALEAYKADGAWDEPVIFLAEQAILEGRVEDAVNYLTPFLQRDNPPAKIQRDAVLLQLLLDGVVSAEVIGEYIHIRRKLPSQETLFQLSDLVASHPTFLHLRELLAWHLLRLGREEAATEHFQALAEEHLDAGLHSSVLLGLGCLANRKNVHRAAAVRVKAASAAYPPIRAKEPSKEPSKDLPKDLQRSSSESQSGLSTIRSQPDVPTRTSTATRIAIGGGQQTVPKAAFTGDLQLLAVPDLLDFLKNSRRTGTLVITSEHGIGAVHMRNGMITGAAAPGCDNIGALLVVEGKLTDAQLNTAIEAQQANPSEKMLGALLVEKGLVDRETMIAAIKRQVNLALRNMVGWTSGQFAFESDRVSEGSTMADIEIELDTQAILLDVLRELDEENKDE